MGNINMKKVEPENDYKNETWNVSDVINTEKSENIYIGYKFIKRLFDIIISLIGIILTFPIIGIFAVLIVIETPGSPLYKQERLGLNGKVFVIYKLRSMYKNSEKNGAQWATKDDERVTKIGKFIRITRIDELPQLYNILKGEMSLIGPRPERLELTKRFNREIPGFINRLQIEPGLTGWAQVNGGYDLTPKEKLELDMYYVKNRNLRLDLLILFKTIKVVLTGQGAR